MECSVDADRAFGPAIQGCRSDFDFTLLFQDSVLSIVPSSVLIVLASVRLTVLFHRPVIARLGWLYRSKLGVNLFLFLTGYKRAFTTTDLGMISSPLYAKSILAKFSNIANGHIASSGNGFALQTFTSLGFYALAPVIPRLAVTGFTFSQSFLVTALLKYLEHGEQRPASHGYGLLGACAFVYIGIAVSNSWYWRHMYKSVSIIRGGLVVSIFEKVLRLPEDGGTEAKATTLMISDVQRIVSGLAFIHEVWAGILETALATYLLQRIMGVSSMAMLGLALACGAISSFVASKISVQQRNWLKAMEQRIDATKRLLDSLKAVKMRGAEDRVGQVVNELRRLEIQAARLFRALITVSVFLSYSTVTLSPLLVFAAYIGVNGADSDLDSATMFSSLAMPALGSAQGCFGRIHAFLETPEMFQNAGVDLQRTRMHRGDTRLSSNPSGSNQPAISIRNASLGWSSDETVLENINLEVARGSFVALVGKTGSGKSLLLKSALGEVKHVSGSIELPLDKVSYCSQTPWLENMSAEQTWTQYGGGDPKSLAEVLEACFLDDIISLPDYRTGQVGSGGVRLSGGQRQRLALARAIALRKEIVLLDDVFSALDRATRQQISTRLLGPEGLLRRLGTTGLFTTHDSSIAMLADQVYEITVDRILAPLSLQKPANGDAIENRIAQGETTEKGFDEKDITASDQAINATVQNVKDDQNEKDTKVSDRQVYLRYVRAMGFKNAGIFLFLVIAFAICLKLPDLWVQWWSTALQQGDTRGNNYWIGMFALLEVLPLLVLCLCIFHLMFFIVPTSASTLHASLLRTVLLAPFAFISRVDTGSLMNRFNQDLMFVDAFLPLDLFNTCAELFTSTFQLILVAIVSKQALAILPVLFAVLYFIQRVYLRSSKQLRLLDLSWKAVLHTKFGETVSGLSVIRANGWLNPMREKFLEKLDRSQEPFYLLYMVQRWLQLVLNLVVAGLAITIAGVAIGMRDKVAVGAVGVAFLNTTTLGETLTNFIISWTSLETSLGAIARVSMFEQDTPREREEQSNVDVPDDWPKPGQVTFENVWATYDDKDGGSSWRLSGVTLTVKPGERVAVCGRTGSGKSTLLLALLGMLHMPVGSVRVDGIDISALQMTILRRRFKVVSQDSFFEPTSTFRQDLDPSGKISDDDIREILRECRVWETVAASGGLDGGIIILDEASSSLDRETEEYIEKVMSARLQNATVIAVMHRLEAVSTYDKVAVLDKGVLVDFGDVGDVKARCKLFK
ncbi:ABC transporter ecdL [Colletotrichum fructicola]|nr:ABC transporter ecdL [Colletotrichum fructicola]